MFLYIPFDYSSFSHSPFFSIMQTYLILDRPRISSLDPSVAECLLQRRWTQLKQQKVSEKVPIRNVCVKSDHLHALTVSQCLNLLPETSEV